MQIRALPTLHGPSDGFLKVQHPHENAKSRLLALLLLLLCVPTTLCLDQGLLPASGFLCDHLFSVLIKLNTTQSPVLMFKSVCFCKPWICWNWGPIFNLMLWQQFLAWLGTGIQTIWWKLGNVFLTEYVESWWLPKQHNMKSTGSHRTGPLSYPNVVRFRQWNYLVRFRKTLWFHLKWLHYIMLCNFKNVPDVSSVTSHTFQGLVRII